MPGAPSVGVQREHGFPGVLARGWCLLESLCLFVPTQQNQEHRDSLSAGHGHRHGHGTGQGEQHREAGMDSRRWDAEKMHADGERVLGLMKAGVVDMLVSLACACRCYVLLAPLFCARRRARLCMALVPRIRMRACPARACPSRPLVPRCDT